MNRYQLAFITIGYVFANNYTSLIIFQLTGIFLLMIIKNYSYTDSVMQASVDTVLAFIYVQQIIKINVK